MLWWLIHVLVVPIKSTPNIFPIYPTRSCGMLQMRFWTNLYSYVWIHLPKRDLTLLFSSRPETVHIGCNSFFVVHAGVVENLNSSFSLDQHLLVFFFSNQKLNHPTLPVAKPLCFCAIRGLVDWMEHRCPNAGQLCVKTRCPRQPKSPKHILLR